MNNLIWSSTSSTATWGKYYYLHFMNEETEAQSAQITCWRSDSKLPVLNHWLHCFRELWGYHLLGSKFSISSNLWASWSSCIKCPIEAHCWPLVQVWCHSTDCSLVMTRHKPTYLHCCPTHICPSWVMNTGHSVQCFARADMTLPMAYPDISVQ